MTNTELNAEIDQSKFEKILFSVLRAVLFLYFNVHKSL